MYVKTKLSAYIYYYRIQKSRELTLNIKPRNWVHKIPDK